jgi:hypothetical protein
MAYSMDMPLDPPTREEIVAHWRTRAEQYRQLSRQVSIHESRSAYEKLADDCDRVADRLENRPPEHAPIFTSPGPHAA